MRLLKNPLLPIASEAFLSDPYLQLELSSSTIKLSHFVQFPFLSQFCNSLLWTSQYEKAYVALVLQHPLRWVVHD